MTAVEHETMLGEDPLGHRGKQIGRCLDHLSTPVANQMHMFVVTRRIGRRAVTEMRVVDQTQLLQQVQRPVHGGDVDGWRDPLDALADLLGGGMPKLTHGVEDQLALRRHAQSLGVQRAPQRGPLPRGRADVFHVSDGRPRGCRRGSNV